MGLNIRLKGYVYRHHLYTIRQGNGFTTILRWKFHIQKLWARLKIRGRCSKKSIKQLNRVSISVSLWLGLVLGLALGLMPSSDIVLKSTVLSSSCVPNFVEDFIRFNLNFIHKNDIFFEPPFGELGVTYALYLYLVGKRVVGVLLAINEHFSLAVIRFRRYKQILVKVGVFQRGLVSLSANFR